MHRSSTRRLFDRAFIRVNSLCLGVVTTATAVHAQANAPESIVIHDASVIDVRTGQVSPHRTVQVSGGRIVRIGPSKQLQRALGARVIDGRGKYLIPGLIDTHVHLSRPWNRNWPDTLAQFGWILASGVTTVREAGAFGLEKNFVALRAANDSGRIMIPRIVISSSVGRARNAEELQAMRAALAGFKARGIDFVKVMHYPRAEALEIIRAAREAGLPVFGHTWEDYEDSFLESTSYALAAVQAGISGLSHNRYRMARDTLLPNAGPRMERSSSPSQLLSVALYGMAGWFDVDEAGQRTLIDTMLARGTWYEPTLGVGQMPVCTRAFDRALVRRYLPFDTDGSLFAVPTRVQADTIRRACEGKAKFVRRFYEAGVPIVTGSDMDPFYPVGVTREMRVLAEAGIPPLGVLQAATLNSARALLKESEIGTVEEGKVADLVLLNANPLTDITNVDRIAAVIANGRLVNRTRLLARVGTTPPMVAYDDRPDRIDADLRALATQRGDSVVEVLVHTDGTMRPEDLRGLAPEHAPVKIIQVAGRTIRARMPAFAVRITSRIRFVTRIEMVKQTGRRLGDPLGGENVKGAATDAARSST